MNDSRVYEESFEICTLTAILEWNGASKLFSLKSQFAFINKDLIEVGFVRIKCIYNDLRKGILQLIDEFDLLFNLDDCWYCGSGMDSIMSVSYLLDLYWQVEHITVDLNSTWTRFSMNEPVEGFLLELFTLFLSKLFDGMRYVNSWLNRSRNHTQNSCESFWFTPAKVGFK